MLKHASLTLLSYILFFSIPINSLYAEDEITEELSKKASSPYRFTGKLAATTDYRSRGISETFCLPAVQGEFDYNHKSGLYAKFWGSNVDARIINKGTLECDFYLGYSHLLFHTETKWDTGLLFYYYPGASANVKASTS